MAVMTPDLRLPTQPQNTATAPAAALVISHPAEDRRLSQPGWLATYQDGTILTNGHPSQC